MDRALARTSCAFEPHGGSIRGLRRHLPVALAPVGIDVGCHAMALVSELAVAAVDARCRFEVVTALDEGVLRCELSAEALPHDDVLALVERSTDRWGIDLTDGQASVWFELVA